MATVNEKMTAIADNIRSKTGKTDPLTLDDMANSVNEIYDKGEKLNMIGFGMIISKMEIELTTRVHLVVCGRQKLLNLNIQFDR